ncbi:MAG: hypothetical protein ACP5VR_04175 [Acidimicrobiales bacterium]
MLPARYAQVVMSVKSRARSLLRRLLVALFLVLVFTGVAWEESGEDSRHLLGADLAVGAGATALMYALWWLAKRSLAATKSAFRQGYEEVLALQDRHGRQLGPWAANAHKYASRAERREAALRAAAAHAGRFVGSTRRAFRDGYGGDQQRQG